jgi:GST-like protein
MCGGGAEPGAFMIHLHTVPTTNGFKASIMLEEVGLPYDVRTYDLMKGEHLSAGYLKLNPVGRLPTIVDDDGPDGRALTLYGSAAILLYLAEKTGLLMPRGLAERAAVYQWLGIVSSDIGPAYTGHFVFNVLAPEKLPWAIDFYGKLCLRMLRPMELRLAAGRFLACDEYTIADVIAYPVAAVSARRHPGSLDDYPAISRWAAEVGERPAVQRGMRVGT